MRSQLIQSQNQRRLQFRDRCYGAVPRRRVVIKMPTPLRHGANGTGFNQKKPWALRAATWLLTFLKPHDGSSKNPIDTFPLRLFFAIQ